VSRFTASAPTIGNSQRYSLVPEQNGDNALSVNLSLFRQPAG